MNISGNVDRSIEMENNLIVFSFCPVVHSVSRVDRYVTNLEYV